MIELRGITKDNFEAVLNLKVSKNQENFVSSTVYSLALAWVYKDTAFPFAIYVNEIPVGFIMLGYYECKNQYTLWKFLIDKQYQNKGYGKKALQLAVKYLSETFNVSAIYTGVALENEISKNLYQSIGFKATGLIENNMEEMVYILGN